jgi:peptidyl-prolyl cis-trans isomerase A (cyclophilin A)
MKKKNAILILAGCVLVAVGIFLAIRRHGGTALDNPASLTLTAPAVYQAKFTTTQGDFIVEVHRDWAPLGADRFYNLVHYGYFDGNSFFRMLPGFVVQFGISPKPSINAVWKDAVIQDDPVTQSNTLGTVTFATAGPNTRTTQIFINLADNTKLDRMGFAPFGKVVQGMDVVQKLYGGYGDGPPMGHGPDQHLIESEGEAYVTANFPKLDSIKTAAILATNGAP